MLHLVVRQTASVIGTRSMIQIASQGAFSVPLIPLVFGPPHLYMGYDADSAFRNTQGIGVPLGWM